MEILEMKEKTHTHLTDKEKLKNLFIEFGIGFSETSHDIICEKGDTKVDGYYGFYITFEFNTDGKFIKVGVWE